MPKITLTADEPYSGFDPGDGGRRIDIAPGEAAVVSDAKAEQLLTDFPDRFKTARQRRSKTPGPETPDLEGAELGGGPDDETDAPDETGVADAG